ncbi:hypothetical protein Tco_0832478 [Tanacetum coccineum]
MNLNKQRTTITIKDLKGPYTPSTVIIPAVPAMDNSPAVPEQTTVETILNMSPENKAHFKSEKDVIHLILTGIGDEIYSNVMHARQLMKCRKLLKGYNKVDPSTFKMSRQTYFRSLANSPLTMEKQWSHITQGFTS